MQAFNRAEIYNYSEFSLNFSKPLPSYFKAHSIFDFNKSEKFRSRKTTKIERINWQK